MEDAIELVLSKRTAGSESGRGARQCGGIQDGQAASGRWPNERPVPTSKMWAKIEDKTKESGWNTLRALRVLKMWEEL